MDLLQFNFYTTFIRQNLTATITRNILDSGQSCIPLTHHFLARDLISLTHVQETCRSRLAQLTCTSDMLSCASFFLQVSYTKQNGQRCSILSEFVQERTMHRGKLLIFFISASIEPNI